MGNLKGSSHEKQINNAIRRLEARGQKRFGTESRLTHSNATAEKREMYLKDFAKFADSKGFEEKLNVLMTQENIKDFIAERTADLGAKTSLDYSAGFNSMLKGLEETRVGIPDGTHEVLEGFTTSFRESFNANKGDFEKDRAVKDTNSFINDLQNIRDSSSIIAELQLETGLRVSEALEVVNNFDKHYAENQSALSSIIAELQLETGLRVSEALEVVNNFDKHYAENQSALSSIIGKGGQEYEVKEISPVLAEKIENIEKVPSYSSYRGDLKQLEVKSHDLRITYAAEKFEELKEKGYSEKEALKEVSTELNHHRESITNYYLIRA